MKIEDTEQLVQALVTFLKKREESSLKIGYTNDFFESQRSKKDFVYHRRIFIEDVGLRFLADLSQLKTQNLWVNWFLDGMALGCQYELKLSMDLPKLIPLTLLENWDLKIFNSVGKLYITLPNTIITYSQVALLNENQVLLIKKHQKLTGLAEELLAKKKIQQIERV